ncbi:MAG: dienelactone hydrolase family protein [Thermodesulfobacteriota bacterium]
MLTKLNLLLIIFLSLSGCAGMATNLSIPVTGPGGAPEQIKAAEYKPDGPGPFPAVVILHDCSGLGHASSGAPDRWARELVGRGYVVLVPDSFTTRGHAQGVCTDPSPGRNEVGPSRRVRDAYAALAYLRTLPYVDGQRVGLLGGSHGGTTTLSAMAATESDPEPLARDKRAGFAAAVALYPGCAASPGGWGAGSGGGYKPVAPLLILIGEKDDWTPAEYCRRLTEAAQKAGRPVTIKVYPGAHHSFDSPKPARYDASRVNPNAPGGRGATTGGNPQAWADSIREVSSFFGRHLGPKAK